MTKTRFMEWVDEQVDSDARLASEVSRLLGEMRLEQELVALRERRGLSQREAAKLIHATQPYVAKLESGRIQNLGVATLVKYAHALGGRLTIDRRRVPVAPHRRPFALVRAVEGGDHHVPAEAIDVAAAPPWGRAEPVCGRKNGRIEVCSRAV